MCHLFVLMAVGCVLGLMRMPFAASSLRTHVVALSECASATLLGPFRFVLASSCSTWRQA